MELETKEEDEWNEACGEIIKAEVKAVEKERGDLLADRDVIIPHASLKSRY